MEAIKEGVAEPFHVVRLGRAINQVVVAPHSEAMGMDCAMATINWVSIPPVVASMQV